MISHELKCIFIHIPKCAGTSIEQSFGHLDDVNGRGLQDHRSVRAIQPIDNVFDILFNADNLHELLRSRKQQYFNKHNNQRNRELISLEEYNKYYKFTFVRNPWARIYSWYANVMRDEQHKKRLKICPNLSFSEFLRRFIGSGALRSQMYWLKQYDGSINLDFVGRFESLETDFEIVSQALGITPKPLPHKIKGSSEGYKAYYTEELVNLVAEFYKEEIELFDYSY